MSKHTSSQPREGSVRDEALFVPGGGKLVKISVMEDISSRKRCRDGGIFVAQDVQARGGRVRGGEAKVRLLCLSTSSEYIRSQRICGK